MVSLLKEIRFRSCSAHHLNLAVYSMRDSENSVSLSSSDDDFFHNTSPVYNVKKIKATSTLPTAQLTPQATGDLANHNKI